MVHWESGSTNQDRQVHDKCLWLTSQPGIFSCEDLYLKVYQLKRFKSAITILTEPTQSDKMYNSCLGILEDKPASVRTHQTFNSDLHLHRAMPTQVQTLTVTYT